jgi:hypothetical protein
MAEGFQFRESAPEILVGSSKEVGERLRPTGTSRVLAVTFADDKQQLVLKAMLRQVTAYLPMLIRQRQTEAPEKIVDALLPDIETSVVALSPVRIRVDAKATILRSGDFATRPDLVIAAARNEVDGVQHG